ncbi:ubiquinol-cytochrome-c reductase complex assembly factor 1-like [Daphnia carinata]|uniref:ubiquinol-cytochrome-c reductase complex assembly factor 1-like n=1 Tax=Daphnia carinata TaxID=120202 RepID=UPI00257EAF31|nr:ubiquinol-cytochrome-c reductase complex assembly factor 1-like [Daphnia carinata]
MHLCKLRKKCLLDLPKIHCVSCVISIQQKIQDQNNLITMQRACSFLLFRRVPFPFHYRMGSFQPLLRHEGICVPNSHLHVPCCRYAADSDKGILQRFKIYVGLGKLSKSISRSVGYKLYESLEEHVNHNVFFKYLKMEDTFHSWFIVRGLHVWMLMVRLMNEGDNGRLVRNALVEAMWEDVEFKSKQIGETAASVRRKQVQVLVDEFQASLFAYDEGLLSSDQVLAGAIWRNLMLQQDFDPRHLDILVDYVRENIAILDRTKYDDIYHNGKVNWTKIRL